MKRLLFNLDPITIIIFSILVIGQSYLRSQNKVVGYYPSWVQKDFTVNDIDLETFTHVIHAFAWPNKDGTLSTYSEMIDPSINTTIHEKGRKILIAIGGWGNSDEFSPILSDSLKRITFISNIISFLETNQYDGVDIDWEFPSSESDRKHLSIFIHDLRSAMDDTGEYYLLSMAISSGSWSGQWFEYDELSKYLDWFGVMTYDYHGSWTNHAGHNSPMYSPNNCSDGSINSSLEYLIKERNIPPSKIILGIPFYGKEFNASGVYKIQAGNVADLRFNSIPIQNLEWTHYWDNYSKVPYLINNNSTKIITYDDSLSVHIKTQESIKQNLSGIMVWAIGYDVKNGIQPLVDSIKNSLLKVSIESKESINDEFRLYKNYPNPFNGSTTIVFKTPTNSFFSLEIVDINGHLVEAIIPKNSSQRPNSVTWKPKNTPSGIYFAFLRSEKQTITKKMLYIK